MSTQWRSSSTRIERTALTALYSELPQGLESLAFDRFGIRQRGRAGAILDFQQMEQDRPVLVGIHPDLAQARADFVGDNIGGIGLDNPAIAAQQVEGEQVGNGGAVGEAASFDPGHASVGDLPAELGEQPGFADAGFADEADGLAMPVFDLPQKIVQDRKLALAIDKNRRARRRQLAQPGAAVRHAEQTKSRDRLGLAL